MTMNPGPQNAPSFLNPAVTNPVGPAASWVDGPPQKDLHRPPFNPQGPAVSWVVDDPKMYPSTYSSNVPTTVPMEGSSPARLVSRSPQLQFSANPSPAFQEGELQRFERGLERGDSKRETEAVNFGPTPFSNQKPNFQSGELSNFASVYEQGNSQGETDYVVPMSHYAPTEMLRPFAPGIMQPGSPYMRPVVPNLFYLFLTGQLPHGTVSHMQSDYETGEDHTTQVGFEPHQSPFAENPVIPHQTQVPSNQAVFQ